MAKQRTGTGDDHGKNRPGRRTLKAAELRSLFDNAPDGIFIVGEGGLIEDVNPAGCALLGYAKEEIVGKHPSAFIHPDSLESAPLKTREVLGGSAVGIEREVVARDGTIIPVDIRATLLSGGRIMTVIRDLRERRAAESARQTLADSLRSITDNAPIVLFALDAEGTFTRSEGKGLAPLGLAPGQVVGQSVFDLYADYPEILSRVRRALTGRRVSAQVEVSGIVFETAYEPVLDAGGRVTGVIGVALDVTDRVRAEEELRRSERRYRALVENNSNVIITYRLEEGPHGLERRMEWVSDSVRAITGYEPEELIAMGRGATIVPPEDFARYEAAFQRAIASPREPITTECRIIHKNGAVLWAEVVIVNQLDEPDMEAIVATFRDITARKQAEERLQQVAKLEAVGRLAGGIAHDFNNILTVILGYSAHALATIAEGSEHHEAFYEIHDAAQRGAALTQQLLAFSRQQPMNRAPMDLNARLRAMHELLRPIIGRGIAIALQLDPALRPIEADAAQIDQMLMNLILNARDAMSDGGTITISTRNEDGDGGHFVVCVVEDTGTGIAADVLPYVFEPFFTTKDVGEGTGMGLAIVHGIVTQTGGEISVDTVPGGGSRFTVRFPAATGEASPSNLK